mmetsp:Transcript_34720/g.115046  ORF Transcript_34720/g.115046 Transcript_34720/m.115046 type:complete len:257 (+) Transcript_34720:136-906(+)
MRQTRRHSVLPLLLAPRTGEAKAVTPPCPAMSPVAPRLKRTDQALSPTTSTPVVVLSLRQTTSLRPSGRRRRVRMRLMRSLAVPASPPRSPGHPPPRLRQTVRRWRGWMMSPFLARAEARVPIVTRATSRLRQMLQRLTSDAHHPPLQLRNPPQLLRGACRLRHGKCLGRKIPGGLDEGLRRCRRSTGRPSQQSREARSPASTRRGRFSRCRWRNRQWSRRTTRQPRCWVRWLAKPFRKTSRRTKCRQRPERRQSR